MLGMSHHEGLRKLLGRPALVPLFNHDGGEVKPETESRLNGVGMVFRFVTPCMIGVLLAMTSYLLGDIRDMRSDLTNHLVNDMQTITNRLTAIETQLKSLDWLTKAKERK